MTPVRKWIKKTLITEIPIGTLWSDLNPKQFKALTGVSHADLLKDWFGVNQDGTPDYKTKGTDPRFTTCTSFLPRFATQVRIAGKLPTVHHNAKMNKDYQIGLGPFTMNTERGWKPAPPAGANGDGPKEGDFFLLTCGGIADHVGIIVKIQGKQWSVVAGGAGGRGVKHDGVKRTDLGDPPKGLLGWLDVDAYFDGWAGPDVGDVKDDYDIYDDDAPAPSAY